MHRRKFILFILVLYSFLFLNQLSAMKNFTQINDHVSDYCHDLKCDNYSAESSGLHHRHHQHNPQSSGDSEHTHFYFTQTSIYLSDILILPQNYLPRLHLDAYMSQFQSSFEGEKTPFLIFRPPKFT